MLKTLIIIFIVVIYVRTDTPNVDEPSIKLDPFNAFDDAKKLCDEVTGTFKSWKNPNKITKLICHRSFQQRDEIQKVFPEKCDNRNLVDKLHSMKFFLDQSDYLITVLFTPPAIVCKDAMTDIISGKDKDDGTVIQIMCSANNTLKAAIAAQNPKLKEDLEAYGAKGGDGLKAVLTGLCLAPRKEDSDCNVKPQTIESEANDLICKNGPDFVNKLKDVFSKYHDPELQKIFLKYAELKKDSDLSDKIKISFQGNEMEAYETLVRSIQNKYMYYAKALNHCIKGSEFNSNSGCVTRIVVFRCEIDLGNIADTYKSIYGDSFMKDFKDSVNVDTVYYEAISKLFGNYA